MPRINDRLKRAVEELSAAIKELDVVDLDLAVSAERQNVTATEVIERHIENLQQKAKDHFYIVTPKPPHGCSHQTREAAEQEVWEKMYHPYSNFNKKYYILEVIGASYAPTSTQRVNINVQEAKKAKEELRKLGEK